MNRRTFVHTSAALATALPALPFMASAAPSERKFTLALTPGSIGVSVKSQRELNDLAFRHGS